MVSPNERSCVREDKSFESYPVKRSRRETSINVENVPFSSPTKKCKSASKDNLEAISLVHPSDALTSTDYIRYVMKQFRPCEFSESDRGKQWNKRQNLVEGFRGLACIHCNSDDVDDVPRSSRKSGRKFFWSSVKRMNNSFSEFFTHLMRCRHCPEHVRCKVRCLKKEHALHLARLPRGSNIAFLQKVWNRMNCSYKEKATEKTTGQHQQDNQSHLVNEIFAKKISPENLPLVRSLKEMDADDYLLGCHADLFKVTRNDMLDSQTSDYPIFFQDSLTSDRKQLGLRCRHCQLYKTDRIAIDEVDDMAMTYTWYPLDACDILNCVDDLRYHVCHECPTYKASEDEYYLLSNVERKTREERVAWFSSKTPWLVNIENRLGVAISSHDCV